MPELRRARFHSAVPVARRGFADGTLQRKQDSANALHVR